MKCVLTLGFCFHEITLQVFLVNHFIAIDKRWMKLTNRRLQEYLDGVQQVLNFASNHAKLDGMISCPCKKCVHIDLWLTDVVQGQLVSHGIFMGYDPWFLMGNHRLQRLLLKFLIVISKKTRQIMPIFVTCCIICSLYMIWHLGQWKKSLVCNNPQKVLEKVLMKMHFSL